LAGTPAEEAGDCALAQAAMTGVTKATILNFRNMVFSLAVSERMG
jgi:hypothetical protein